MANKEAAPEDFYAGIDTFKQKALQAGLETCHNMDQLGVREVTASRGESAQVIDLGDGRYLASVNEELGTKNIEADAMQEITGKSYYFSLGLDTAAAQFNDLITVGAAPISSQAHFVTGDRQLFNDPVRSEDLISGYKEGCDQAGANWLGGETGLLEGNIVPGRVILSGSANGIISSKEQLILGDKLQPGDKIIYLPSSGIHANGLTDARKIADLPGDYLTPLEDGVTYGEALLTPTPIYVDATRALFKADVDIHYMCNITGHGWRKLMRANRELTYRLSLIPEPQPVFNFIQEHSGKNDKQMYGTFNMGLGFAIFINKNDLPQALGVLQKRDCPARLAGHVEEGSKQVIIEPKNIVFDESELAIR